MHHFKLAATVTAVVGVAAAATVWHFATARSPVVASTTVALGRQTLPRGDGWGSDGSGTTGGANADDAHIFLVHDRKELIAALGGNNATDAKNAKPKMIFIANAINLNVNATNQSRKCEEFADPAYTPAAYQTAFDPATFGRKAKPSGPLEEARVRSSQRQMQDLRVNVGPNTTLFGLDGAALRGGSLTLDQVSNVIVRNIALSDVVDCFPAWDPTDAEGKWKPQADLVSLTGASHVWLDHNALNDGDDPDEKLARVFDRPFRVHDGAIDVTKGSDLVTVSNNDFSNHDNVMLIGGSDTEAADRGKLRVTVHHNRFNNVIERAPRVRFGQVDVFNNLYILERKATYLYSIGVGVESKVYAENNLFRRSADVPVGQIIENFKGTAISVKGSMVQVGTSAPVPVNLLDAFNAAKNPDLTATTGFTPTLRLKVDDTAQVAAEVERAVGVGRVKP